MNSALEEVEILLVEDNASDAELTIRVLRKNNLANKLVWVKDGAEALDFIFAAGAYAGRELKNGPKVILLDLRLPKIDGLEVLRRIKGSDLSKTIPVVVLTSSKEDLDVKECYKLGVNSYIGKPVEFDKFSEVVRELGFYWLLVNRTVLPERQAG